MAQKANRKKRAWKEFCREQVKKGLINDEKGGWTSYSESCSAKDMHRSMKAGYRV